MIKDVIINHRWWIKKELFISHDLAIWVNSYLPNNDFPLERLISHKMFPTVKERHDKMIKRFNDEL